MSSGGIFVDPERESEFGERGFTVVRLLSADEAAEMLERLTEIMRRFGRSHEQAAAGEEFHVTYYDEDFVYQREVSAMVQETLGPRLAEAVRGYRVSAGGAFVKAPGGGEMGVHRDFTATVDPEEISFTGWCALADVDEENGALCMLPGSHKVRGHITGPGVEPFFAAYPDRIRERSVKVPVRAGEAILFRTGMIHWSLPNRSRRLRPAAHFVGIKEGSRHALYLPEGGAAAQRFNVVDLGREGVFDPNASPPSLGTHQSAHRPMSWAELRRQLDAPMGGGGGGLFGALRHGLRRLTGGTA